MVQFKTVVIIVIVVIIIALLAIGGYFAYQWIKKKIFLPAGSACALNIQCESGACGTYIGLQPLEFCCIQPKVVHHQLQDWCADLPPGSSCAFDEVCAGNDECGRLVWNQNTDQCCTGSTVNIAGLDYCVNLPNDTDCSHNEQCTSGFCDYTKSTTPFTGKCTPKGTPGQPCDITQGICTTVCAHDLDLGIAACCPSTKTYDVVDTATGRQIKYCADKPNGSKCFSGDMCQSGLCTGSTLSAGVCFSKEPPGSVCSDDNHCTTDACAFATTDDYLLKRSRTCCPKDDTTFSIAVRESFCADVLPRGANCLNDNQCTSGECSGSRCT